MRLKFRMVMVVAGFLFLIYTILSFVTTSLKAASHTAQLQNQDQELDDLLNTLDSDKNFVRDTLAMNRQANEAALTPKLVKEYEDRLANLETVVHELQEKLAAEEVLNQKPPGEQGNAVAVVGALTMEEQVKMLVERISSLEEVIKAGGGPIQKRNVLSSIEQAAAVDSSSINIQNPNSVQDQIARNNNYAAAVAQGLAAVSSCPPDEVYSPQCKSCFKPTKKYNDKINYVHVPRGAGSSFSIPVRSYLACEPLGKGCWGDPAVTVQGNTDCGGKLTGCYGLNSLKNKNSVVILRNPINRVRSAFVDKQFPSGTAEQKAAAKETKSVSEYVALPGISNCQTKILLGRSCTDPKEITASEIDTARSRLTAVDFFGLTEHYNSSVCLLYKIFGGVPAEHDFQVIKKSTIYNPHTPLSPEDVEAAKKSETIDLGIYDFAKELFMQKLQEHRQPVLETL